MADLETTIRAMNLTLTSRFNEGDLLQSVSEYYADDALLIAPGQPEASGLKAIQSFYAAVLDTEAPRFDASPRDGSVEPGDRIEGSAGLAYVTGRYVFALTDHIPPSLSGLQGSGRRVTVFRQSANGLVRAIFDAFISD